MFPEQVTPDLKPGKRLKARRKRSKDERELMQAWLLEVSGKPDPLLAEGEDFDGAIIECHHTVSQQVLRRLAGDLDLTEERAIRMLWDPRNGMPVSEWRHDRAHGRHEPILRSDLRPEVFEFVKQWGLGPWLDRTYPLVVAA